MTRISSSTLGPNSMLYYECDAPQTETGETHSFTDGDGGIRTFSITCKNAGSADVQVNWNSLSSQNDILTAPPSVALNTPQSIGHLANGVICIGVFEARDGGSPATQGTISASDWLAKWMEKSERILGQKKLHEFVLGGVTHALSFNLQNSDPSVEYFFSSQVLVSSTSATITGYLNAGFRYFEVEFYQASASTFQISVGSFTAGNTFQLSDLTGSLDNFRLLNLHEMFVINISATNAASGQTYSHSAAETSINLNS